MSHVRSKTPVLRRVGRGLRAESSRREGKQSRSAERGDKMGVEWGDLCLESYT